MEKSQEIRNLEKEPGFNPEASEQKPLGQSFELPKNHNGEGVGAENIAPTEPEMGPIVENQPQASEKKTHDPHDVFGITKGKDPLAALNEVLSDPDRVAKNPSDAIDLLAEKLDKAA
jgi:hypothetical protein